MRLISEKLIELLKEIPLYNDLKVYYKYIYTSKGYSHKIMITRRSYVLFKIFEYIFTEEEPDIVNKGTNNYYSSNYISQIDFSESSNDTRILIVDDIIINGRTIRFICDNIYERIGNNIEIKVLPFLINEKALCIESFRNQLIDDLVLYVPEYYWREYSDYLNAFVLKSMFGYVSYIDAFRADAEQFELICNKYISNQCQDISKYKNNIKAINDININAYYFDAKHIVRDGNYNLFLSKYSIKSYLRVYEYDETYTVIPFVYLPSIKLSEFKEYFLGVLSHFNIKEKQNNIYKLLSNLFDNNDNYIFLYEWLTYYLSKYIQQELEIYLESKLIKILSCKESFGKYYNLTQIKFKKGIDPNNNYKLPKNLIRATSEKECYDTFKSVYNSGKREFSKILKLYLAKMREIDQEKAFKQESRNKGIRLEDVLEITKNRYTEEEVIKLFTSLWDSGDGSVMPKIFDNYICNGNINGEQIYKSVFNMYSDIAYDFVVLFKNSGLCKLNDLEDFANYMDENLNCKDYSEFVKIIINFIGINNYMDSVHVETLFQTKKRNTASIKLILNYLYKKTGSSLYLV